MEQNGYQESNYSEKVVYREIQHRPARMLATNRGMLKMIFLGILTLGIYPMIINAYMAEDINIIACAHDGKRTTHPTAAACLMVVTLGIYAFVWPHKLCNRIGAELQRRRINYRFDACSFWLWNILGMLIVIGPLVYLHKYCKAMNLLAADYNERG